MYTNTSKKDKDSTQNPAKAVRRRTRHTAHSTRHQSLRSGTEITAKARRSLSRRKTNAPKLSLRGISVRPRTLSYRNACPKPGKPDSGIHHLFPAHPPQKTLDRILHQAANRHRPHTARHGGDDRSLRLDCGEIDVAAQLPGLRIAVYTHVDRPGVSPPADCACGCASSSP